MTECDAFGSFTSTRVSARSLCFWFSYLPVLLILIMIFVLHIYFINLRLLLALMCSFSTVDIYLTIYFGVQLYMP